MGTKRETRGRALVPEQDVIFREDEKPVPPKACQLLKQFQLLELPNKRVGRGLCYRQRSGYFRRSGHWLGIEMLKQLVGVLGTRTKAKNDLLHLGAQLEDSLESIHAFSSSFNARIKEKFHPMDDIVRCSHESESVIVCSLVLLHVRRKVK